MKKIYTYLAIIISLISFETAKSQDAQFSQMETLPLLFNPAATRVFSNNDINIGAQYRNQWSSLSSSINTFALSYNMPVGEKWAVGGYVKNTDEIGIINTFSFIGSASYMITQPKSRRYILSVGAQIGFIYKRINAEKLSFDDQYDEGYFNIDLPTGETFIRQNSIMPDANIGFNYRNINLSNRFRPFAGLSAYHITYPKEQFLDGSEGRLPLRWMLTAGTEISINNTVELVFDGFYNRQRDFQQGLVNLYGIYKFEHSEFNLIAGIGWRSDDAVIMQLGFKHGNNIFRFSYDFTTSGLKTYTRNRGAIEFSFMYVAGKKRSRNRARL